MGIGKIVRQLRKERGWKLEELSRRSGVAVGTISAIEVRDSVRSEYASQLAHGLGVPVSVLLGSPTNPTPPALGGGSAVVSLDAAIAVLADAIERSPYRGQENLLGMLAYMGKSPGDEINRQAIAALLQNKQQPDARPKVAA